MSRKFSISAAKASDTARPIRILVVDDQKVVRERIKEIVAADSRLKIVGTANDGLQAIAAIESLQTDVVLMDIEMPCLNGIEVTKIISRRFATLKVLVISTHDKEEYIYRVVNAGADGYILKQTPAPDLVDAIHAVYQGYAHFGPKLLDNVRLVPQQTPLAESVNPQKYPPQQQNTNDYCRLVDRPPQTTVVEPLSPSPKQPSINLVPNSSDSLTDDDISTSNPWSTWGSVAAILLLSSLLLLGNSLKHRSIVRANAIVHPQAKTQALRANTTGRIDRILAEPGDNISKGETIATIDRSQAQTKIANLNQKIAQGQQQLEQVDARLKLLEQQVLAEVQSNSAKIKVTEAQLASSQRTHKTAKNMARDRVTQIRAALQTAQADLDTARSKLQRYESVSVAGGLSQTYLLEAKSQVLSRSQEVVAHRAELDSAIANLNADDNEIKLARRNIQSLQKSGQVAIANLKQEQAALKQQRLVLEHQLEQNNLTLAQTDTELAAPDLIATTAGQISQLNLQPQNGIVRAGEEIARIATETEDLVLKATIPVTDIGQIALSQPVEIQLPDCNDPDYILPGRVTQIQKSANTIDDRSNKTDRRSPGSLYEIEITPDSTTNEQGNSCGLKSVELTTVKIITKEETMMQFVLRKARLT